MKHRGEERNFRNACSNIKIAWEGKKTGISKFNQLRKK